jgi:hypothetical protein
MWVKVQGGMDGEAMEDKCGEGGWLDEEWGPLLLVGVAKGAYGDKEVGGVGWGEGGTCGVVASWARDT